MNMELLKETELQSREIAKKAKVSGKYWCNVNHVIGTFRSMLIAYERTLNDNFHDIHDERYRTKPLPIEFKKRTRKAHVKANLIQSNDQSLLKRIAELEAELAALKQDKEKTYSWMEVVKTCSIELCEGPYSPYLLIKGEQTKEIKEDLKANGFSWNYAKKGWIISEKKAKVLGL